MTTRSFRDCARATGIRQMPQVECPDGTWLTDTTLIIRHFEKTRPDPKITPRDPAVGFIARLIEDFGDESLWRPALYYRWAFADDARLMSGRIARGMLRDVKLPYFLRRQIVLRRQKGVYLRQDGVTPSTSHAIEKLYFETLAAMESALEQNLFVLGVRPTEADFGLFGSMFRHFFSDPTPAKIMRDFAPRTIAWVARVWALKPGDLVSAPQLASISPACGPLLRLIAGTHLPYMDANAKAVGQGAMSVRFEDRGANFECPASPYRAWCLGELQAEFSTLDLSAQKTVTDLFPPDETGRVLSQPRHEIAFSIPSLPIIPTGRARVRDRSWV